MYVFGGVKFGYAALVGNLRGVQTLSGECGVYGKSQKERRWKVTKYWMLGWVWWTENAGESLWSVGRV